MSTADSTPIKFPEGRAPAVLIPVNVFNLTVHNGEITVVRNSTGAHHTYRVETIQKGPLAGKRVVKSRTGARYQSFAFVTDDGRVCVWKKFRAENTGDTFHDKSARMLERLYHYQAAGTVEALVSGRCRKCDRPLTHPESIASGVGPVCRKRLDA